MFSSWVGRRRGRRQGAAAADGRRLALRACFGKGSHPPPAAAPPSFAPQSWHGSYTAGPLWRESYKKGEGRLLLHFLAPALCTPHLQLQGHLLQPAVPGGCPACACVVCSLAAVGGGPGVTSDECIVDGGGRRTAAVTSCKTQPVRCRCGGASVGPILLCAALMLRYAAKSVEGLPPTRPPASRRPPPPPLAPAVLTRSAATPCCRRPHLDHWQTTCRGSSAHPQRCCSCWPSVGGLPPPSTATSAGAVENRRVASLPSRAVRC